ncbi:diacylglycerol kinase family protein [Sulfurovum sp. ST-21]|uniref:NAD(+)/NADH kinase n=1 Tax=Sulfurovum indicum TaxID=2779528 RepID=A0A7M1S0T0_9BACT|nr:diacylglycerol kinase family protein [Sulfurovum indicum]QOR61103.1 NAD(+)/NADH kinase [Sulfurovum indicum]
MRILSIGKKVEHKGLTIDFIEASSLPEHHDIEQYDYIIINGGDGTVRRVLKQLHTLEKIPVFILNPTGSFNVVARIHRAPEITKVLDMLAKKIKPKTQKHHLFKLNDELFLFSAGNMGDLQHIFLSETLRFGWLKHGMLKYILALIFLLPVHLIMTPFMLMSKTRFFIFTPLRFIKKFGTFYGEVDKIEIDLENEYNMLELDGDIVTVHGKHLYIRQAGNVPVVTQ